MVVDTSKCLLMQEVTRAGFYKDGRMAASITNSISIKLESHCVKQLGWKVHSMLTQLDYKHWAWGDGTSTVQFSCTRPQIPLVTWSTPLSKLP